MHKGKKMGKYIHRVKSVIGLRDVVIFTLLFFFFFLMFHTLCLTTFRAGKKNRSNYICRPTLALCVFRFQKTNTFLYIGKAKVKGPCCKMKDEVFDSPGRAVGTVGVFAVKPR